MSEPVPPAEPDLDVARDVAEAHPRADDDAELARAARRAHDAASRDLRADAARVVGVLELEDDEVVRHLEQTIHVERARTGARVDAARQIGDAEVEERHVLDAPDGPLVSQPLCPSARVPREPP